MVKRFEMRGTSFVPCRLRTTWWRLCCKRMPLPGPWVPHSAVHPRSGGRLRRRPRLGPFQRPSTALGRGSKHSVHICVTVLDC